MYHYHARRETPVLVDQVDEGEGDGEEAEEQVGEGEIGDENIPSCRRHLKDKIWQNLVTVRMKKQIIFWPPTLPSENQLK